MTLRNVPADFKMNSLYVQAVGWPFDYHALESFYLEAEQEVGVAGDNTEDFGSARSGDFPMPLIPQTYLDKQFTKALEGSKYQVRSTPQGRNSVATGDRLECRDNSSCIPVCRVQVKYDATIHRDQAEAAGGGYL